MKLVYTETPPTQRHARGGNTPRNAAVPRERVPGTSRLLSTDVSEKLPPGPARKPVCSEPDTHFTQS